MVHWHNFVSILKTDYIKLDFMEYITQSKKRDTFIYNNQSYLDRKIIKQKYKDIKPFASGSLEKEK